MVDAQGLWAAGCYIPAFARRYPFVLAKTDSEEKLTVCIDEVYAGLSGNKGEVLFGDDGTETPYLKRVLDFLQLFHTEAQRTATFANRLKELGLLVPKVINVERGSERQSVGGLWIVDAAKLRGIDDARAVELFRSGYLAWIEAHLLSLGSLSRLVARLDASIKVSDEAGAIAAAPATTH
jgi:hypothetical protein